MKQEEAPRCSSCGFIENWLLHNVRHRGDFFRYCTSCVLQLHRGSFCSKCFDVFEGPPPGDSVKCSKCPAKTPSISHSSCVGSGKDPSFVCASCSNPSFSFFNPVRGDRGGEESDLNRGSVIDITAAKALLAAARIAAQSMSRAAAAARQEADRKSREAAFARKRAREALERFSSGRSKDKEFTIGMESGPAVADIKKNPKTNSPLYPLLTYQKRRQDGMNDVVPGDEENLVGVAAVSSLVQRPSKNGEVKVASPSGSGSRILLTNVQKEGDEKSQRMGVALGEDKGRSRGFSDSGIVSPVRKLSQDVPVPKASPEVMFNGSQSTASMRS